MKQYEDRLSKFVTYGLFHDYAHVEVGSDLLPNAFYADSLIIPSKPLPESIPGAGLLARHTGQARCLFEPFGGQVHAERFEANLCKLRLALLRAHKDGMAEKERLPQGVLWVVMNYWPKSVLESVLVVPGEELEPGVVRWVLSARETVFVVNTQELEVRDDTFLFSLLGKGGQRREAMARIFEGQIEPYVDLLNDFDRSLRKMVDSGTIKRSDREILEDLMSFRDTREEVLRGLGEMDAHKGVAKRMLGKGFSMDEIVELTGLSVEQIEKLRVG